MAITKKIFFLLFFLSFFSKNYSQVYFGLRAEPAVLLNQVEIIEQEITNSAKFGGSLILNMSLSFGSYNKFLFSIRPGFALSNYYAGLNAGLLCLINLAGENSIITGLHLHTNMVGGGHSIKNKGDIIPYIVLGYRFFTINDTPLELQLMFALNNVPYIQTQVMSGNYPYYPIKYYRQILMIKLGIGFDLKL
jgi:hypothetical protein